MVVTTPEHPPPDGPPLSTDEPPGAPATSGGWRWGRLATLGGAYSGALVASVATRGVPLQREQVLAWIIAGLAVVALSGPRRRLRQVLFDWLPFLAVLVLYDYSRGIAEELGFPIQYRPQLRADELLFGGTIPTIPLQERFIDPNRVHTWEVVPALIYASHFVVPFVVAAVLWVRDRARWAAFTRRFVALSFLGVATFVVFPAAPPWLAAQDGYLAEAVSRPVGRGWSVLGLDIAEQVLSKGRASVNVTAAIPSLHTAYAALVAVVLWPTVRLATRALLAVYAVAMGVVLVMGGEHYVVDVLIGWLYVAIVVLGVGRAERWWRARGTRRLGAGSPSARQDENSSLRSVEKSSENSSLKSVEKSSLKSVEKSSLKSSESSLRTTPKSSAVSEKKSE